MRRRLKAKEIAERQRAHRYHDGRRDLTARLVERLKGPGRYHDGFSRGLYLQVTESGAKSWLFRYQLNNGKQRGMGLGPYPAIDLREARRLVLEKRRQLVADVDPIDQRRAERAAARLAAQKRLTFGQAVERYLKQHADKWTSAEHRRQFPATLKKYAAPLFSMDVAAIGLDEVLHVLQPIWNDKTETADRIRRRIEATLDWAQAFRHRPPVTIQRAGRGNSTRFSRGGASSSRSNRIRRCPSARCQNSWRGCGPIPAFLLVPSNSPS